MNIFVVIGLAWIVAALLLALILSAMIGEADRRESPEPLMYVPDEWVDAQ